MNIFFDLDGTLIDISKKYYEAHKCAATYVGVPLVPFRRYWSAKRNRIGEEELIHFKSQEDLQSYENQRIEFLEDVNFLKYDVLFPWVIDLLKRLQIQGVSIYVLTARRNVQSVIEELKRLQFYDYFNDILVTTGGDPVKNKVKLISQIGINKEDLIVGDSEADIAVARELNIKCIAVYSGIRTKELLKKLKPDFLVKNAWDYFTED